MMQRLNSLFARAAGAASTAVLVAGLGVAGAAGTAAAADMSKTLHITFQVAESGFDPVLIHDYYSGTVVEAIYDTLLTYDYLARPSKLAPRAAVALPEITDGGRTWTFHIKKGIVFQPDPVFAISPRSKPVSDV